MRALHAKNDTLLKELTETSLDANEYEARFEASENVLRRVKADLVRAEAQLKHLRTSPVRLNAELKKAQDDANLERGISKMLTEERDLLGVRVGKLDKELSDLREASLGAVRMMSPQHVGRASNGLPTPDLAAPAARRRMCAPQPRPRSRR